jgi:hypothetical protein
LKRWEALLKEKDKVLKPKQTVKSKSKLISQRSKESGKISDCFGGWKMTDEEEQAFKIELFRGWQTS